jgi:predicted DNA binding CopG/RHH family protein
MKKKIIDPFKNLKLDSYEKELSDAIENGNLETIKNHKEEKEKIVKAVKYKLAKNKKDKRVNIRIVSSDLEKIQTKALENGLPYQTLITTILKQYANGKIKIIL